MKRKTTQRRSVAFSVDQLQQIEKLANKKKTTASNLIRTYVDKGLEIDGYTQDIDFIAGIVRQEVKNQLTPQVERIVKIMMKSGKINAALYYLTLKLYVQMVSEERLISLKEMATETRKLGVKYMQYKDHEINQYLEDDDLVFKDLEKI